MVIAAVFRTRGGITRIPMDKLRSGARPKGHLLGYQVLHHKTPGLIGTPVSATPQPVPYNKALAIHTAIYMSEHGLSRRTK
jgi:hypothetical protein